MSKIIAHIDLNAFFATAEELRHKELIGKPIAVGGIGRRGVVSTCNYEARKYGIHSGMPGYQAKEACPSLIFLEVDFDYYEMLSNSFFNYLKRFSPLVEPASIDEAYVDLTEQLSKSKNPEGYLRDLQKGLLDEIGLKCSIGVAPTRFLAKMASDMQKPLGLTFLRRKDLETKLYPLSVSAFYGIGKKSAPQLVARGYKTIGDLANGFKEDDPFLVSFFGKSYLSLKDHALGRGDDNIYTEKEDPKSIGRSHTLSYDINTLDEASVILKALSKEVAKSLKEQRLEGKTITVHIKDSDFIAHSKAYSRKEPFINEIDIFANAERIYIESFLGANVRLIGVSISNLEPLNSALIQLSFDNYEEYEQIDKTKLLVEEFNRKLNGSYLKLLSEVKKNGNK